MGEVASGGRTVLFVSHNLGAVQSLCGRSFLLGKGRITRAGPTSHVIASYSIQQAPQTVLDWDLSALPRQGAGNVRFQKVSLLDHNRAPIVAARTGEELIISLEFSGSRNETRPARLGVTFYDALGAPLFICANEAAHREIISVGAGGSVVCRVPRLPLGAGYYKIGLFLEISGVIEDWLEDYFALEVTDGSFFGCARNVPLGWEGRTVLIDNQWSTI